MRLGGDRCRVWDWGTYGTILTMPPIDAVILGLIQGLTEFLPISSTGHLILVQAALGLGKSNALAFDAMLHLATVAALVVFFFSDIWLLAQAGLRKLSRLPVNTRDETLLYALLIGTIPAVILGLALESYMKTVFRSPLVVAGVLVAGSLFFIFAEWRYQNIRQTNDMSVWKGLQIGFFQCLALLPGFSRSGAAIGGGMLLGLSRSEATRFSFLLGIPVLAGAGAKMFLEMVTSHATIDWTAIAIGASVAFVSGLLAIRLMLAFLRTYSLWAFVWYRIILAGVVVALFFLG